MFAACESLSIIGLFCCAGCTLYSLDDEYSGFSDRRYEIHQDYLDNGIDSRFRPVPKCCLCVLPMECVCCFCGCWCEKQDSGEEKCVNCECCCDVCRNMLFCPWQKPNRLRCRHIGDFCCAVCCDKERLLPAGSSGTVERVAPGALAVSAPQLIEAKR